MRGLDGGVGRPPRYEPEKCFLPDKSEPRPVLLEDVGLVGFDEDEK